MWQGLRASWGILARPFFVFFFRPAELNNPRRIAYNNFLRVHHFAVRPGVYPFHYDHHRFARRASVQLALKAFQFSPVRRHGSDRVLCQTHSR